MPPSPPKLITTSTTSQSVALHWRTNDTGGAPIRGYLLSFRREFGDWEEIIVDRRATSYLLENLQCGTRYQFTLAAFNKVGSGSSSSIESVRTVGNKPVAPRKQHLIRPNITSIILELASWQDGGCTILYFTIEYRSHVHANDWIIVSSNVAPQIRFLISDLEPAGAYNLRVTAYNNAGATISEYFFETLSLKSLSSISGEGTGDNGASINVGGRSEMNGNDRIGLSNNGNNMNGNNGYSDDSMYNIFFDSHLLTVLIISTVALVLTVIGICCFIKLRNNLLLFNWH